MLHLPIEPGASLYGLGEAAGPLARNGRVIRLWNSDVPGYSEATPALYQCHPWVLGVRADGSSFGLLVDSSWPIEFDLRRGVTARVRGPAFAAYIIERNDPMAVVRALAEMTGRMPLPPIWALGYHQSRWGYDSEARIRELAGQFRTRRIPCDAIWLDIDYMDGYRSFTFDAERFPDPARLNGDLHAEGFRTVWILDPGIRAEPGYNVYDSGRSGGHFLKDRRGRQARGRVWPGTCAFPDFTRAETRAWWSGLVQHFLDVGMHGLWNDMNEPAVFDHRSKTLPKRTPHEADDDLGGRGPHARYHNLYGALMARATHEGMLARRPDRRPFVLTRAAFLGSQRHAATWTGDNVSDARHMGWSIPMVLNLGLSGQPFSGPDIGGFIGDATPDLFATWMGIGALLPFARGHCNKGQKDHEPWSFGEDVERFCRMALQRRYRLLPYLYTLFYEAATTGAPVARPLFFADPADPSLRDADDAFLLGQDLLVRAESAPGAGCSSPMPPGVWRHVDVLDLPEPAAGSSINATARTPYPHMIARPSLWYFAPPSAANRPTPLPELFIRAGSIIPLGPVADHTGERPLDPLTLLVFPDTHGRAAGRLYEDAGDGFGYQHGDYLLTTYRARSEGRTVTVYVDREDGNRARPQRELVVAVIVDRTIHAAAGRDGRPVTIEPHCQ